jgi:sulfatase modifying factor 1
MRFRAVIAFSFAGLVSIALLGAMPGHRTGPDPQEGGPAGPLPAAAPHPGAIVTNSIGMRLVEIPAGEFIMGNREGLPALKAAFPRYAEARFEALTDDPPHRVRITKPFLMGVHEVTIAQFRRFVTETGYRTEAEADGTGGWGVDVKTGKFLEGRRREFSWRSAGFPQADDHPVVNITWGDAREFCRWLGRREGQSYRLPTEAEWEYACRAGTTTRYYCGDDPEALAAAGNIYDAASREVFPAWGEYALAARDGFPFTAPVGRFRPNAFGLYDMHGNVWEWCSDRYGEDYYRKSPVEDPRGPEKGGRRVRRGGAWHTWPLYARAAFRNYNTPESRYLNLGMRVVREPSL